MIPLSQQNRHCHFRTTLPILGRGFVLVTLLLGGALALGQNKPAAESAWQPLGISGSGTMFFPVMSPADPRCAMVQCDMSNVFLTHDGGMNWQMVPTNQVHSNTHCAAAFDPTNPQTIIAAGGESTLKISRDGGGSWNDLAHLDGYLMGAVIIDAHDSNRMMVGINHGLRVSADQGKTWQPCGGVAGMMIGGYFAHVGDTRVLFVASNGTGPTLAGGQPGPPRPDAPSGGGVWRSSDDGKTFTDISEGLPSKNLRGFTGSTKNGRVTLYCTIEGKGASGEYVGGIYRWQSDEKIWKCANGTGLNLETKAFDQWTRSPVAQYWDVVTSDSDPSVIWATGGGTGVPPPHNNSIWRSDDGGKTWREVFFGDPRFPGCNVEKDYVVIEDGQFYSRVPRISLDAHNPNHVLAINSDQVYITNDGGKSWQLGHTHPVGTAQRGCAWQCNGLVVTTTWHYEIDPNDAARRYICYSDIGFARSQDSGRTWSWWSQQGRAAWYNTCYEVAFDPGVPGHIWGAFSVIHDIPNANIIFGGHQSNGGGGICVSNDYAATWTALKGGLPVVPCTSIVLDPKSPKDSRTLYAGFFGEGVYKSTDGGKNWVAKNSGLGDAANKRVCRVQLHADGTLFALVTGLQLARGQFQVGGAGLYKSSNGGDSWSCITTSISALWGKDFTLDPHDSKIIYLGLGDNNVVQKAGGLWRTTDGGKSWSCIFREGTEHFGAYLSPTHPGWIYATLCERAPTYGLFLSKDNGKTFEPMKGLPIGNAMRVCFDPADPKIIYVCTFGGSIWRGPAE